MKKNSNPLKMWKWNISIEIKKRFSTDKEFHLSVSIANGNQCEEKENFHWYFDIFLISIARTTHSKLKDHNLKRDHIQFTDINTNTLWHFHYVIRVKISCKSTALASFGVGIEVILKMDSIQMNFSWWKITRWLVNGRKLHIWIWSRVTSHEMPHHFFVFLLFNMMH